MNVQSDEAGATIGAVEFSNFLENTPPSRHRQIVHLWDAQSGVGPTVRTIAFSPIRIHCWNENCDGIRTFRCTGNKDVYFEGKTVEKFASYECGDCGKSVKRFSLLLNLEKGGSGHAYKYGEEPPFGVPVPSRVLRLFGSDSGVFLKGRSCEAQGLGVGAFSYYRKMVEKHRHDLFDQIIKVCETISASPELIDGLRRAQQEISFSKAMEEIKPGIPEGLLINGHNPLQLLHTALSAGLHDGTDEECLEAAQDVRVVLTDLVERIAQLKKNDAALSSAVQRLANRGQKARTKG